MSLREKIADRLAYFDECGPGPVSRGEYLEDADEIIKIVGADGALNAARDVAGIWSGPPRRDDADLYLALDELVAAFAPEERP